MNMKSIFVLLASMTVLFSQQPFDKLSQNNVRTEVIMTKTSNDGPKELLISLSPIGNTPQKTEIEIFQLIKNKKGEKIVSKKTIFSETGVGDFQFVFPEIRKSNKFLDWMVRVVRNGSICGGR